MGLRYWIGHFTYKHTSPLGHVYRKGWVRKLEFFAVHDKLSLTYKESDDDVYLYTSEYGVIAKYSISDLKENWKISTICKNKNLGKNLVKKYKSELLKITKLSEHYCLYGDADQVENELFLYADAYEIERDELSEYFDPNFLGKLRKEKLASIFVPSITSIWRIILREDIENDEIKARNNEELEDHQDFSAQGFNGDDHADFMQQHTEEMDEDIEASYKSNEEGWWYGE
ncbi:MAG: hypothetical protein ACQEXG_17025 [Pseudomonadota bacterium]